MVPRCLHCIGKNFLFPQGRGNEERKIKAEYHFIATVTASGIIYCYYRSISCGIISFVSGFLIDLDHVLDYYLLQGVNFRYKQFFKFFSQLQSRYLIIIFHSLEFLGLLWALIYRLKLGPFWISFAIGFSQHMAFDLIFNRKMLKTHYFYFFTLRALKRFQVKEFLP